jgi:hypothetical protein
MARIPIPSRRSVRSRWPAAIALSLAVAGCAAAGPPTADPSSPEPTARPIPTSASAPPSPSATAAIPEVTPSATVAAGPPVATLTVEGGDPVEGQLGTFLWLDGGTDAPWLPGAPIIAAAGEPMDVLLDPVVGIGGWQARIVPAGATGPDGATGLGEGSGTPRIMAPAVGTWTLEIAVQFADGLGSASYFWQLRVA